MAESVVVSFRLNPDDPEQRKALRILERLRDTLGLDTRHIMTKALLAIDGQDTDKVFISETAEELRITVDELKSVLGDLRQGGIVIQDTNTKPPSNGESVDDKFISKVVSRRRGVM